MSAHINPSDEQLKRFEADGANAPVAMLNLLKFRARAQYAPESKEPGRSGQDAYMIYGETAARTISEVGGQILFASGGTPTIGPDSEWDMVLIAYYPTRAAFLTMIALPHYLAAIHHRDAALSDSRLIPMPVGKAMNTLIAGLAKR